MGKSLTEVAKAILTEGAYPSVTPDMHGKFDRDAKSTTTAKSSLRPSAGYREGQFSNPGSMKPTAPDNSVEDLGPALVRYTDTPPTAKVAGKMSKDISSSSQSRKGTLAAEKSKKQTEIMEEDYELDEEQLDEISGKLAGTAAEVARRRGQEYADDGDNITATAYMSQADRLRKKADVKSAKERKERQLKALSSGKRSKLKLDEISGKLAGRAADKARRIGQAAADDGDNIIATGYMNQADRLQSGAEKRFSKERKERQLKALSSGKRSKMKIDETSGDLVGRAANAAFRRGQAAAGDGDNDTATAYMDQFRRLEAKAKEKFSKERKARQLNALSSGKRSKMEEEIEISEELEAFINEMIEEGYSESEIAAAIDENFEIVDLNEEDFDEEYEVDMSEHVEALFAGEELSEEFKQKAIAIFEAAVKQKVEEELAVIEEAYAETLEEQIEQIQEELSENVDSYLGYVVEQWMNENEVAIEAGLRTELTEDFISGLRNLFAEHYIDIPEDKVSVVEEMAEKVVELESKLDEEIDRNVFLTKALNESAQNEILLNACAGLTEVQSEKLKSLAEGVDYSSIDEFENKINILRESYFNNSVRTNNVLDSNYVDTESNMLNESLSGPMAVYVRTLGKTLPR